MEAMTILTYGFGLVQLTVTVMGVVLGACALCALITNNNNNLTRRK